MTTVFHEIYRVDRDIYADDLEYVQDMHRSSVMGVLFGNRTELGSLVWEAMRPYYYYYLMVVIHLEIIVMTESGDRYFNTSRTVVVEGVNRADMEAKVRHRVSEIHTFTMPDNVGKYDGHVVIHVRDVDVKLLEYARRGGTDRRGANNCFFHAISKFTGYKLNDEELPTAASLRKEVLGWNARDKITFEQAERICRHLKMDLTIHTKLEDGSFEPEPFCVRNDMPRFLDVQIVWDSSKQHFEALIPHRGRNKRWSCPECGHECRTSERYSHQQSHLADRYYVSQLEEDYCSTMKLAPPAPPQARTPETMLKFSVDYAFHIASVIVNKISEGHRMFFLAGPGGTGKTFSLDAIKRQLPQARFDYVAPTWQAAKNLHKDGTSIHDLIPNLMMRDLPLDTASIHRYVNWVKWNKDDSDMQEKWNRLRSFDVLIVDEVSMVSSDMVYRMEYLLRLLFDVQEPFGGKMIIFMGDFLQLPPIGGRMFFTWSDYHKILKIPLTFPWRYINDPTFGDFIMKLNRGTFNTTLFKRLNFNIVSWNAFLDRLRGTAVNDRPITLTTTNAVRKLITVSTFPEKTQRMISTDSNKVEVPFTLKGCLQDGELSFPIDVGDKVYFNSSDYRGVYNSMIYIYKGHTNVNGIRTIELEDSDGRSTCISVSKTSPLPISPYGAFTVHKAQGASLDEVVIIISAPPRHLLRGLTASQQQRFKTDWFEQSQFYVAMSRARTSKGITFVFEGNKEDLCSYIVTHRRMLEVSEDCLEMMLREDSTIYNAYDETTMDGIPKERRHCTIDRWKQWLPTYPSKVTTTTSEEEVLDLDKQYLYYNASFLDNETASESDCSHHYDENGRRINDRPLAQSVYQLGFMGTIHGRVIEPSLFPNANDLTLHYDEENKAFNFHRGRVRGVDDSDRWIPSTICQLLMDLAKIQFENIEEYLRVRQPRLKTASVINLSNILALPHQVCTFNGTAFDIYPIIRGICNDRTWVEAGFTIRPVPNSGTTFTDLVICLEVKPLLRRLGYRSDAELAVGGVTTRHLTLLRFHDIRRLTASFMDLSGTFKAFAGEHRNKTADQFQQDVMGGVPSPFLSNILAGLEGGKGHWPHLFGQMHGYKFTLEDDYLTFDRKYFPEKIRDKLTDDDLSFNPLKASWEYNVQDLNVTLALYAGFNKLMLEVLGVSVLRLQTAQQLTTAMFCKYTASKNTDSNLKGLFGSHFRPCDDRMVVFHTEKRGFENRLTPDIYVLNNAEKKEIMRAMVGGKAHPRAYEFVSEDPTHRADGYCALDESGMYGAKQERCFYPFGKHYRSADVRDKNALLRAYQKSFEDYKTRRVVVKPANQYTQPLVAIEFPTAGAGRRMYMVRAKFKANRLVADSYFAVRRYGSDDILWSTSDPDDPHYQGDFVEATLTSYGVLNLCMHGMEMVTIEFIYYWEKYGKIFEPYAKYLREKKLEAEDRNQTALKTFYKLLTNAFYGSLLKQDHNSVVWLIPALQPGIFDRIHEELRDDFFFNMNPTNNTIIVVGERKQDRAFTSRPVHLGLFLLDATRVSLFTTVNISLRGCLNPLTIEEVAYAIQHKPLYGDTDSLYMSPEGIRNICAFEAANPERENRILFQEGVPFAEKAGLFADENAKDLFGDGRANFREGRYARITRYASFSPKLYTMKVERQDWNTGEWNTQYKTAAKGVSKASRVGLVNQIEPEIVDELTHFDGKSARIHDIFFKAFTIPGLAIKSRKELRFMNQNFRVLNRVENSLGRFRGIDDITGEFEEYEKVMMMDVGHQAVLPLTRVVASMHKEIESNYLHRSTFRGNRMLTDEEADILKLESTTALNVSVPLSFSLVNFP